jgi:hypothetical protein
MDDLFSQFAPSIISPIFGKNIYPHKGRLRNAFAFRHMQFGVGSILKRLRRHPGNYFDHLEPTLGYVKDGKIRVHTLHYAQCRERIRAMPH